MHSRLEGDRENKVRKGAQEARGKMERVAIFNRIVREGLLTPGEIWIMTSKKKWVGKPCTWGNSKYISPGSKACPKHSRNRKDAMCLKQNEQILAVSSRGEYGWGPMWLFLVWVEAIGRFWTELWHYNFHVKGQSCLLLSRGGKNRKTRNKAAITLQARNGASWDQVVGVTVVGHA